VHDVVEVLFEEVSNNQTEIGGKEFRFLCAEILFLCILADLILRKCEHAEFSLRSFFVAFLHVSSLENSRNGWRVSRGSADAEFFEFLNQRCFGESWLWSAESFGSLHGYERKFLSNGKRRKHAFFTTCY